MVNTRGDVDNRNDPPGSRTTAPATVDMLTYPDAASTTPSRRQWGVRLRVGSGGWTPPLAIDPPPPEATDTLTATSGLQDSNQPLLIRSMVVGLDTVTEVMLRIEGAGSGFGRTQLLRLEPFVVLSNRTGLPMQLLQCCVRAPKSTTQADAEGSAIAAAARAVEQSALYVPGMLYWYGNTRMLVNAFSLQQDWHVARSIISDAACRHVTGC